VGPPLLAAMARQRASKPPQAKPKQTTQTTHAAATSLSITAMSKRHAHTALLVLLVYVAFKWLLPWLAALTPPGINPEQVAQAAERQMRQAVAGCEDPCKGMNCPDGWTTGLKPDDECKCICVRQDPKKLTKWDLEKTAKQPPKETIEFISKGTNPGTPTAANQGTPTAATQDPGSPHAAAAFAKALAHVAAKEAAKGTPSDVADGSPPT